jgi:hypothetical protein
MPVIPSALGVRASLGPGFVLLLALLAGCTSLSSQAPTFDLRLYQQWELQPGDLIGGRAVLVVCQDCFEGQSLLKTP